MNELRVTIAAVGAAACVASAHAQIPVISGDMTVNAYAVQCQHPAMKSQPAERLRVCVDYINAVKQSVGAATRTPECWQDLEKHAMPGAIQDVLFYLATQPEERRRALAPSTRDVVLLAAKRCR